MYKLLFLFLLMCSISGLAICSENKHPARELYDQASDLLHQNKLLRARDTFQQIQLMYPFSTFAQKAQFMSSLISYTKRDYVMAVLDTDKYISMYSYAEDIQYIFLLRAMSYYHQIDIIGRDSQAATNALQAFDEIIKHYSTGRYIKMAKHKRNEIMNYLAAAEMKIGIFYLSQVNYTPALDRFTKVIEDYHDTNYVGEAIYRMSEIFQALGLEQEMQYYTDKLHEEYPTSMWTHENNNVAQGLFIQ